MTVLLIAALSLFAKLTNDPEMIFPEGSRSAGIYQAVRDAGLYSTLTVELDFLKPDGLVGSRRRIDGFASRIASLPGVVKVEYSVSDEMADAFSSLPSAFVQLLDPSVLDGIDPERASSSALAALSAGAPAAMLRSDPGNLKKPFTDAMQAWRRLAPYRFSMHDSIACDPSRRYALLRIETDPAVVSGAERISGLIGEITRDCPGMKARVVSPLVHSLENESIARRDVFRVGAVSAVALALVFLFLYRGDWRALWIPVTPFVASFPAAAVCAAAFDRLSLMVLGIGGGVAGLAVDQGIHVYSAVRGAGIPEDGRLARALLMALATSVAAFASVACSGVPVFFQLGVFVSLTLAFNLLLSGFALPRLFGERKGGLSFSIPAPTRISSVAAVAVFCGVFILFCVMMPRLKTDFSLSALDGTSAETRAVEAEFAGRWSNDQGGESVIVTRRTEDELLAAIAGCSSWAPAALVPPSARRTSNAEAWRSPAVTGKLSELKRRLAAACRVKGLPEDFFAPFFDAVKEGLSQTVRPCGNSAVGMLLSTAVRRSAGKCHALIFVPKGGSGTVADGIEGAFPVTPQAIEAAAAKSYAPGFWRAVVICAALQALLAAFVYRRIVDFAVVFLPAVSALLAGLTLAAAVGFTVDVTVCLASVLVFGLAVDYGVFALYRSRNGNCGDAAAAMVLSAVTTLAGAGAMVFAGHPAVSRLGTVLFFGILFAAASALFLAPAVMDIFRPRVLAAFAVMVTACGCASTRDAAPVSRQPPNETRLWNVTANALWHSFPMIVAVKVDPADRSIHAVGTSTSGITLFESHGENGRQGRLFVSPAIAESGAEALFGRAYEDFSRVFFSPDAVSSGESGGLWPFFGWSTEWEGESRDGKSFRRARYDNHTTRCGYIFREIDGDGR